MVKINYKTTVHIANRTMYLKVSGILPDSMKDRHVRMQAVFTQRGVQRRFPMAVRVETEELSLVFRAGARIRLPYVFRVEPKGQVTLTYAFWSGTREILLDDQPFPVDRDQFSLRSVRKRKSRFLYGLYTLGLPVLLARDYLACGRNFTEAKKRANAAVYRGSGYSYSPRQRNTDYFAAAYHKEVRKESVLKGNKVLFLSERLPEEGGNLLRIRELFINDPRYEVTEFIHTETVDRLTKKELAECALKCAQARVIILEDFYPQLHSIHKRPDTKIVQLWHACGAFKTFGLTRMGKKGGAPQSSMNHRNYDLVPVSGSKLVDIYAEAFAISPSCVKALGVPRTDSLFDESGKEEKKRILYEKYPFMKGKRVVLFAPTFRGDGNKDAYYPQDAFNPDRFLAGMPEDVILIIKHHPFVHADFPAEYGGGNRIIDLTGKDHINDLMLISDLMITDYSSSIFEAAILDLPMVFYAFDEEDYIRDRDFYFGYRDFVPGPVVKDQDDLIRTAGSILAGDYKVDMSGFRQEHLDAIDGRSAGRIADYIKNEYLTM